MLRVAGCGPLICLLTVPGSDAGSSGEGETEAEWVMKVAWAIADGLLAALPSWTERVPILEHLVTIDLPVPGGCGAEEYR